MPEIIPKLALGFLGSGLALYIAMLWPVPMRLDQWLDEHGEMFALAPLFVLNVSGWIVALLA